MARKISVLAFALMCLALVPVCGPKVMAPAQLNSPEHHVRNGYTLLKAGKLHGAYGEFKWAKGLDPTYAPAYMGMGLVYGLEGKYDKGLSAMAPASRYARTDEHKIDVHVGYVRFYIAGQDLIDPDWLKIVRRNYQEALAIDGKSPRPYFYMGLAYKADLDFPSALGEFSRVIDLNQRYREDAKAEFETLKRIEAAGPRTELGKQIAIERTITRAEAVALIMAELPFDEQFRRQASDSADRKPPRAPAKDISNHPFAAEIHAVLALDLNGFKPYPDNSFRPDQPMTRAGFALVIEDLLIRVRQDEQLATRFVGTPSPFPDLRNDLSYFNAVMVVTERGMMESADSETNDFEPMEPVSGVDALSAIHSLRGILEQEQLNHGTTRFQRGGRRFRTGFGATSYPHVTLEIPL